MPSYTCLYIFREAPKKWVFGDKSCTVEVRIEAEMRGDLGWCGVELELEKLG